MKRKGSLLSRHALAGVILAVVAALVLATAHAGHAATAATASTSYTIKATLNTKQEVPKPKDAVHAKGTLTGKLTLAGKKSRFTWSLKLSHLSGRVRAAEIAMGARGKVGITMLPLCNKCRLNSHGAYIGPYVDNKPFVKALLHGRMYVNVTTKLNPKGEIRGQIKATAA
jgi:hypothetical protein